MGKRHRVPVVRVILGGVRRGCASLMLSSAWAMVGLMLAFSAVAGWLGK
jgi:hypothetical protein